MLSLVLGHLAVLKLGVHTFFHILEPLLVASPPQVSVQVQRKGLAGALGDL